MSSTNKIILAIVIIIAIASIYYYLQPGYNPYNYPTPSPSPYASYTPSPTQSPKISPTPSAKSSPSPSAKPSPAPAPKPSATPTPTPSSVTYNISAVEFRYAPNAITAKAGQMVAIVFSNNGALPHNLTFTGISAATQTINPGQTDTIRFTAPAAGTYTFFCSVDSHKDLGLVGTLTVQ